jgi:hypothetical protein
MKVCFTSKLSARGGGFETGGIADFQIGRPLAVERRAGLETCDTADLEVCATRAERRRVVGQEQGIALVITLVMLAVVTVMAIIFLAVTRRERSSVKLAEETAIAKDMADAALERAKAEAIAAMNAAGSKLHYDIFNSQTFFNPAGFTPSKGRTNTNVGPVRDWPAIRQNDEKEYLTLLGNLQYDPAVPVFIQTNQNGRGDLRFYLDFNRNRQFETNGVLPELDFDERPIAQRVGSTLVTNLYKFTGDPEWVGNLERPDYPHSETNRFVGRMAYLVLPAGKSLDLNFMHNAVNGPAQLDVARPVAALQAGFSRSQGVGSWEINLAGFLRGINTNNYGWGVAGPAGYQYRVQANQAPLSAGSTFSDAQKILSFRYTRPSYLDPIAVALGAKNMLNPLPQASFVAYQNNRIEDFGDRPYLAPSGEIFFPPTQAPLDADDPTVAGWPGSFNTNAFTDLQQLFNPQITSLAFQGRLQNPALRGATAQSGKGSYDRYTYYRLAAQLGTDSTPALDGKIHLNFRNPIGEITNSVVPWTSAVDFFTNAAELMLKASIDDTVVLTGTNLVDMRRYGRPPGTYYRIGDTLLRTNFSLTNIQVEAVNPYGAALPFMTQNEYTPTIHRILQVAANIWDNMNDKGQAFPYYPTVFAPEFTKTSTNIIISGFREVTNTLALNAGVPWRSMTDALTNAQVQIGPVAVNLYGQHYVVGAKKGHPNFNELSLQVDMDVSRKLSATRANANSTNLVSTNQAYIVNMSHRWGMEAWNSYRTNYQRAISIFGDVESQVVLRDGPAIFNNPPVFVTNITMAAFPAIQRADWVGATQLVTANFQVLFDRYTNLLNERSYITNKGVGLIRFGRTNLAEFGPLERTPQFFLYTTNRVRFWIIDNNANRIIDFVSFDKLSTVLDIGKEMYKQLNQQSGSSLVGSASQRGSINENMFWDPTPIGGVNSGFTVGHSNQLAVSSGEIPEALSDSVWRPYSPNHPDKRGAITVWRAFVGLPFRTGIDDPTPSVTLQSGLHHQVPFTPTRTIRWRSSWQADDPLVHYMHEDLRISGETNVFSVTLPGTNLWNIGKLNVEYRPWGGYPGNTGTNDIFAFNVGTKDPGIRRSDDWEFPVSRRSTVNNISNLFFFPNIGTLGQVHRGTPWQTLYLKSIYWVNPDPTKVDRTTGLPQKPLLVTPSEWVQLRGSVGTYPTYDWRLLDVFTTAVNENAARGLLSVNQTNTAAWSAVLGGVVVAKTAVTGAQNSPVPAEQGFDPVVIEPGTPQMDAIVRSIIEARTNQYTIVPNPNPSPSDPRGRYLPVLKLNRFGQPVSVFEHMGDVLGAPALSVQNPYLRGFLRMGEAGLVYNVWNDQAVEYIPQQVLSLLRKDEPRFVVYAFGQSLKPAPRSLTSDPNFYHMCTNYQIMGEVITKTTFRVEGEPFDPRNENTRLRSLSNPLRPVVEKYEILPPPE